jgi:hypothetical protein
MGFFKRLFCKNKEDSNVDSSVNNGGSTLRKSSELLYYINIPEDNFYTNEFGEIVRGTTDVVYGPFTLSELKNDYPILKDTLITTNSLNGEWYEAQCFECFDELFNVQQGFRINEFGEILRS